MDLDEKEHITSGCFPLFVSGLRDAAHVLNLMWREIVCSNAMNSLRWILKQAMASCDPSAPGSPLSPWHPLLEKCRSQLLGIVPQPWVVSAVFLNWGSCKNSTIHFKQTPPLIDVYQRWLVANNEAAQGYAWNEPESKSNWHNYHQLLSICITIYVCVHMSTGPLTHCMISHTHTQWSWGETKQGGKNNVIHFPSTAISLRSPTQTQSLW